MTGLATLVVLRSRGGTDAASAAATVSARPGEIAVDAGGTQRLLRVGSDVVGARFDESVGLAGRLALLAPDGTPVAVLYLDDWTPPYVAISGYSRGGIEDALVWTGVRALTDAAGLPVRRGRVDAPADVRPRVAGPRWMVVAASVGLGLAGVAWVAGLVAEGRWIDGHPVTGTALLAMALMALLIGGGHAVGSLRSRRLPAGEPVAPRPSVPVTRRFVRDTRVLLSPAVGPLEALVVRDSSRQQLWLDGPSSPLGVHRAVVVTPSGATAPERVDLIDGLGRQVVRLPWDEWFGGSDQGLDRLAARGIPVERVTGPGLGAAVGLLWPRSTRYALELFSVPGAFGLSGMSRLALAASALPIVVSFRDGTSALSLPVGLFDALCLLGPMLATLLVRPFLDVPRAAR